LELIRHAGAIGRPALERLWSVHEARWRDAQRTLRGDGIETLLAFACHGIGRSRVTPWLVRLEEIEAASALAPRSAAHDRHPKASSHQRRAENYDVFDFELSGDARMRIAALPNDERDCDPPWCPDWSA
jgi:hypothetical protein